MEIGLEPIHGLVAFIDILGGHEVYNGTPSSNEKLKEFIKLSRELRTKSQGLKLVGFSDSMYLIQEVDFNKEDGYPGSAISFLENLSDFQTKCMSSDMPLKGGISYGEVSYLPDPEHHLAVGTPILRSYSLETIQNWAGIIMAPDWCIEKRWLTEYTTIIQAAESLEIIKEFEVPITSGLAKLRVLTWRGDSLRSAKEQAETNYSIYVEKQDDGNQRKAAKYPGTCRFIDDCIGED